MKSWDQCCQDLWLGQSLEDERGFRFVRERVVRYAEEAAAALDLPRVARVARSYYWVRPLALQGSLPQAYDLGVLHLGVIAAERCLNLQLFHEVYRLVADLKFLLDGSYNPRPNSEVRWMLLRIIADCKWQDSWEQRERLWAPEWIHDEFDRLYSLVAAKLKTQPSPIPGLDAGVLVSLCSAEFALLKLATRWLPERQIELVQRFNRRWGASLACEDGHFKRGDPLGKRPDFYWDYEIAKRWISGRLSEADLDYCHGELGRALRELDQPNHQAILTAVDLQYHLMRPRCGTGLKLLEANRA
jgi:hypothetical protein